MRPHRNGGPRKNARAKWLPETFVCAVAACSKRAEGSMLRLATNIAFFQLPSGWFVCPTNIGVGFFCSHECTKVMELEEVDQSAVRVPCSHCGTSGMAMQILGPKGEGITAPPVGWCGFLMPYASNSSRLHLACSRHCIRLHAMALANSVPLPPLRLV